MSSATQQDQETWTKAKRVQPDVVLGDDAFEEGAGYDAELIRAGHIQYWRLADTFCVFTLSAFENIWQMATYITERDGQTPDQDLKAIVSAFWDAQQPEYVTALSTTTWPCIWLFRSIGFQQTGALPLTDGPAITWGYRKCHS